MSSQPSSGTTKKASLLEHAREILTRAEERGVPLRLAGSAAIACRCGETIEERRPDGRPRDLDFVALRAHADSLGMVFGELGYENDRGLQVATEGRRGLFTSPAHPSPIDVFFDRLEFCHPLDLRGRLAIDPETLTLADLLLSKLQYVKPREEDLEAVRALLRRFPLGDGDGAAIDRRRLVEVLSASWGFYHTATLNLDRATTHGDAVVTGRVDELRTVLTAAPKGIWWTLRAWIGPRVQWYQDVEGTEVF
jgi:hypothetical protein